MEPNSWPQGWSVRAYFVGRPKNDVKQQKDSKTVNTSTVERSGNAPEEASKVKSLKDSVMDRLKTSLGGNIYNGFNHAQEINENSN